MLYRDFGKSGVKISAIGLGGHEFHSDHRIAGFQDDSTLAVKRGHIFPGFGGDNRIEIVKAALDAGITMFDVTIDSEKEAMGRILDKLNPSVDIFVQTRPEGMVYTYDPYNAQMAQYALVRAEVLRALKLLRRETIDIYNFAFMADALEHDPDYLDKIGDIIHRLKAEGLIRFASADTFSGPVIYAKQINTGYFDSMFINVNPIDQRQFGETIQAASHAGMAVLGREIFKKGRMFHIPEEHGWTSRDVTAKALIKWTLRESGIDCCVLGVSSPAQLKENLKALETMDYTPDEQQVLDMIQNADALPA